MRKILLFILLLASLGSSAQLDYFTITKSGGSLMGCAEHLAPANTYGHKEPWIVYLHGIDHNRSAPANANDTTRIMVIAQKGIPKLVASAPLPYYQKPGGSSRDIHRWNVIAPQNTTGQWFSEHIELAIAHIRTAHPDTDTSLIIIVGYSLGGGGVQSNLWRSGIGNYIKYAAIVAPGYNSSPTYGTLNPKAINIDVFATVGDQSGANVSIADGWVNGVKANGAITIPNYFRFTDMSTTIPDHDYILQKIVEDTTAGDSYLMTNGSTWTRPETILQRGLRFKGPRRQQ
jgi:hypothetical protein